MLIFTGLAFPACSSDDNNDNGEDNGGNTDSGKFLGASAVFEANLPQSIGNATLTYNAKGFLEKISTRSQEITFTYQLQSRATMSETTPSTVLVTAVNQNGNTEDEYTLLFVIGSNGFAASALQTYSDNETDNWTFEYNSDKQLKKMTRTEGENEVTTITYSNGNITGVRVESEEDPEGIYTTSITYTSKEYPNGIENKGALMLFDLTFGVDMDEMEIGYYAGLLGKATKKLPLERVEQYEGDDETDTYPFTWTMDEKGYPTMFSYQDGEYTEKVYLAY